MARWSRGMIELATKAFAGLGGATGQGLAFGGSLAGRVVGGFLAGVAAARYQPIGGTYHDAAKRDQTNADWRAGLASADQAILDELDTMLARSRRAIANDGWAASTQGAFGRYVVGGGITARSAARHPTDRTVGLLREFNAARDRLWEERCYTPRLVDAEETKTMAEKQRVWMNELVAAGGLFMPHQYLPDPAATRVVLQEIEYEQRDELVTSYEGRPVRGGIEVGQWHQPIAYHLYTAGHPLDDYATTSRRVPASRCYHVYKQDRVRQRVGTPWMRPVLSRLRQLAMYEAYTMIQARGRAANVGFIGQENPATSEMPEAVAKRLGLRQPTQTSDDGEIRVNVAPGTWHVLKPGQKPYMPTPGTPDTMFVPFVDEQLRGVAAGTGLDFATVARWYAEGNFSSQRQAKLDIWAEVDWIQDLLFVHRICRADLEEWTELAIRERRLAAPGFFDSDGLWRRAYLQTNWQGPPRESIDRIKDEAAWDMAIRSGRASPQDYANEHGRTIEQTLSEIAEFRTLAAEQGVGDVVDAWLLKRAGGSRGEPRTGKSPDDRSAIGDSEGTDDEDIASLVARQHVLTALLDGGDTPNGRHS